MCIKERAKFNSNVESNNEMIKNEKEMLEHAIRLANAVDDDATAEKLQKALDSWEEE